MTKLSFTVSLPTAPTILGLALASVQPGVAGPTLALSSVACRI